jgi:hypothetical protein
MSLLNLEKAAVSYEENANQTDADAQKLVGMFSETFNLFCELLSEYLQTHHKNFSASHNLQQIIENSHKAGFLAEHDTRILLKALKEKDATRASHKEVSSPSHPVRPHILDAAQGLVEVPLIHNIETYTETMQTIMREIKP